MKNLKKVLALVTVVAVLLTCVPAFAVSYSDVAATASYAEAVEMTSALGIFTGYPDGTFLPDNTITRAEAAAVIARFLGQESTALAMSGATKFTDMVGAEWANGYVNYGVQKGYINGRSETSYDPSADVSYEEIVKMIVAALGYTIKAEANGGYPSGYLAVASQLGVTKGTSGSNGAASRATVARLIYNALTVPTMYISKYNSDGTKEYSEDGPAILYNELKVTEYVGVITDTYMIGLTDVEADKTVTVKYEELNGEEETGTETFLVGATDAADYLGYKVTVYVAENEETGDDEIIAVAAKGNQNDVVTVKADNFAAQNEEEPSKVYYWKNKDVDKKESYLELADGVKAYENYASVTTVDFEALEDGVATFISNDGDNDDYEYVIITSYFDEFVIDEIDAENYIVNGKSSGYLNMDPEDETTLYVIVKDGVAASFEDLEEGDVVSQCGESGIVVLNVSSNTVEGTVNREAKGKYTIDGTQYELSAKCTATIELGAVGTFYLNVDGLIVDFEGAVDATGFYGYFIASDYKSSFGKKNWSINFVDENGSEVTATLAAKVKIGTGNVTGSTSVKSEEIADLTTVFGGPTLFKYDTNAEGEITKIILADTEDDKVATFSKDFAVAADKYRYDEEANAAGEIGFSEDTVVFVTKAETVDDAEDIVVSTIGAIFEDGEKNDFAYDVYDLNEDVAGAIVAFNAVPSIDEASNVLVITALGAQKLDDEDGYFITGIQGGKEVTYYINDEAETYKGEPVANLDHGDVVMLSTGVEYVTDLELKVDYDNYAPGASSEDDEKVDYKAGEDIRAFIRTAVEKDGTSIVFATPFENAYGDTDATSLRLGGRDGISFTIVSKTGNGIVAKAGSYNSINANSNKLTYNLYVRMLDSKVIDVVAFEYVNGKDEAPLAPAPATEAPATEVPATEVPGTEAPATEVPATEVPGTEAPATEVPATEVPATEVPATEVPATEVPATEVPATEVPATEVPATEVPVTEAPITTGEPLVLGRIYNNEDTVTNADSDGPYTIVTNGPKGADASGWWWSDIINGKLNEGKTVELTLTYDVPAGNVDDCFSFGYMGRNDFGNRYGICTLARGTSGTKTIVLTNVDGTYYYCVDGGTTWDFEIPAANVWNYGIYSQNAAGHVNSITISLSAVVY